VYNTSTLKKILLLGEKMYIAIGVCRERVPFWEHTDSLSAAERFAIQHGIQTGMIVDSPTYIHRGRERITDIFLNQSGATHLCFVDSDNTLPKEALWALAQRDLPIVGSLYFGRRQSPEAIARNFVDDIGTSRTASREIRRIILENNLPIVNAPQYIEDAPLLKIDVLGFGCIMIKREVIVTMKEKFGEIFGGYGSNIGEDTNFCMCAKECGFDIYLDTGVQLGHLKIGQITVAHFMQVPEWIYKDD
jgi:hypothetical protein